MPVSASGLSVSNSVSVLHLVWLRVRIPSPTPARLRQATLCRGRASRARASEAGPGWRPCPTSNNLWVSQLTSTGEPEAEAKAGVVADAMRGVGGQLTACARSFSACLERVMSRSGEKVPFVVIYFTSKPKQALEHAVLWQSCASATHLRWMETKEREGSINKSVALPVRRR